MAGVGVLVASIGAIAACGSSSPEESTAAGVAALESANVIITLHDSVGNKVGEGAGVLIAPKLVLTSAHLVAGKAKWLVSTADGKKTAVGTRGLTYDWMEYRSLKSHPRKHDVAVIYLDKPIQLAAYPKLATGKQSAGSAAKRVRHRGQSFTLVDAALGSVRTFPHAYTTEMSTSETLDTGGAVINGKGEIVGVVTGRGMQTSKLYIARTDKLVRWLSPKVACAGGTSLSSSGVSIKTYGAPPPKQGCEKDGGSSGSSGSSGSGGGGGTCDDGGGNCSGDCSTSTGGGSNTGGSDDSNPGGGGGTTSGGDGTSGSSGSNTSGSDGTPSGSDGTAGSSGGSNTGGSDNNTSGGGSGSGSGDEEVCEGPSDNPEECPPEPGGCEGSDCGGSAIDNTTDYGDCACSGSASATGIIPPLR